VVKDGRTILHPLDLTLAERRVGIIGRNGSGKSTLARLFNGIETPSTGTVLLGDCADRRALRRGVGFVFQNPDNQIVYPIVEEDLAFGLKNLKLPPEEIRARIDTVLDRFGLAGLRGRFTHQLSGGEKQMIALAGVLVMRPATVVLDEPATLLDLWNRNRLMQLIAGLEEQVIMVSHDLEMLARFDRVLLVEAGRIAADGPPDQVIARYRAGAAC
ncbi:cobalt ABC transporter ATP-binding protein, partial [Defluviimonas sp. 20V17]